MMLFSGLAMSAPVFAEPTDGESVETVVEDEEFDTEDKEIEDEEEAGDETDEDEAEDDENKSKRKMTTCERSLESIGWLVCPTTGKIAEAVDWLYDKIETVLVINPVEMKDGSPIYEVWKYIKGITNIIFIIFLLIVIYSQITGLGISNYGIKKALPKLIIAAILVNLSFLLCSLAVDVSNVIGQSLRGVFTSIQESTIGAMELGEGQGMYVSMAQTYSALAGGVPLAVGAGAIAFETGAIWMLIPVVLGAIVAVVTGLITIALRQAVVALLIMIAPMAMVAYMLPNTEEWFNKWKKLLIKMLIFYPMFSLLFGASSLAGFAIITSATDGFWVLVGIAVQIFPLFFAWSLMKLSGTILGTINTKMRGLVARPVSSVRSFAESRRESTKMRYLASDNVYTPSLYLRQFISNRRIHREEELKENTETVKNRGLAYSAKRHYKDWDKGILNSDGEEVYETQARNMRYKRMVQRHTNNMNEGFSGRLTKGTAHYNRVKALDEMNMNQSDYLKMEMARGEMIDYRNAVGFHKRMEDAMNLHMDLENGYEYKTTKSGRYIKDENGEKIIVPRGDYEFHFDSDLNSQDQAKMDAFARYNQAKAIMNGNLQDTQYAAAYASHAYDTQAKIISTKFQKYFELVPPTRDVRYRLEEFSKFAKRLEDGTLDGKAVDNIDAIISGLRILNQRGDTDFLKNIMDDLLDVKYGGLELGTHASQALASFLMFEVKDNDPFLRRFGKYINLETARRFDENKRQKETVDYEEYVKGYHYEPDGNIMYAKKDMVKLMEGTPLDGIERTALDNYDNSLRQVYTDEHGNLDLEAYEKKRKEVDDATAPQFISANLKYLSGSEQIVSAVKSKTGYAAKQDSETGKYNMVAIWDDPKEEEKLFNGMTDEEKNIAKSTLKKFYRNQTLKYLQDQTPAQILGLRSDYKEPLLEHLFEAYLFDDEGNEIPERVAARERALDEINNSNFGETDPEKIDEKRKEARDKLRMHDAGETFREILYKKGKLEQIDKSKRSGAANNAKDWVRSLLLLDSGSALREWIDVRNSQEVQRHRSDTQTVQEDNFTVNPSNAQNENSQVNSQVANPQINPQVDEDIQKKTVTQMTDEQKRIQELERQVKRRQQREEILKMIRELKEQQQREADPVLTPDQPSLSVYDASDIANFTTHIEDIWEDMKGDDDANGQAEFFKATRDYIVEEIGAESYVVKMYEKYYQDNPDGEMYDLYRFLIDMLESLL